MGKCEHHKAGNRLSENATIDHWLIVGSTTCNEILYIELGVPSIKTKVMMKQYEFWRKVNEMNEENPIKYIIQEAKRYKLKEVEHYEQLLEKYDSKEEIKEQFFEETRQAIRQKAKLKQRRNYLKK